MITPDRSPLPQPSVCIGPSACKPFRHGPALAHRRRRGPTTEGAATQRTMQVVLVSYDDLLNLRENPGVDSPILEALYSGQTDLIPTGQTAIIDGSPWYEINTGYATGWVHGRYVTEQWCASEMLMEWSWRAALDRFAAGLTTGIGLAETVSCWRGLYVVLYRKWVRVEPDLHAGTRYNWGFVADGNDEELVTATLQEVATEFLSDYRDPDVQVPMRGLPRPGYIYLPQECGSFPWVVIYDPGDKDEYSGFDWTAWVVFLELDEHDVPRVVGIEKQEWGP